MMIYASSLFSLSIIFNLLFGLAFRFAFSAAQYILFHSNLNSKLALTLDAALIFCASLR